MNTRIIIAVALSVMMLAGCGSNISNGNTETDAKRNHEKRI